MKCLSCGSLVDNQVKFCGNCGNKFNNIKRKKDPFALDLILGCFVFWLTVPLMLLVYMFNCDSCNFHIWTAILYFVPFLLFDFYVTAFKSYHLLDSVYLGALKYVVFQFVVNTIVLIRLIFKLVIKKEKLDNQFWLCIGIVLLNYIMMAIFIYVYVNIGGCNPAF